MVLRDGIDPDVAQTHSPDAEAEFEAASESRQSSRQSPSLKARALALLSRREYSRLELARKLAPHAQDRDALEALLDELAQQKWLSTPCARRV